MPYLRLALAAGVSPLMLRVRRGDVMPPVAKRVEPAEEYRMAFAQTFKARGGSTRGWFGQKPFGFSCFPSIFSPPSAVRSLRANLKLGRNPSKAESRSKVSKQVYEEPSTPSTKVSTK